MSGVVAALSLTGQALTREPGLMIDLNDSGRLQPWLSLAIPVPEQIAQAFKQAMGYPAAAVTDGTRRPTNAHVDCPAPTMKSALQWSAHWDLTALKPG